jgi:hypothetical protein
MNILAVIFKDAASVYASSKRVPARSQQGAGVTGCRGQVRYLDTADALSALEAGSVET